MKDYIIWEDPPIWSGNSKPVKNSVAYGIKKGWISKMVNLDGWLLVNEWAAELKSGDVFSMADFQEWVDGKYGPGLINNLAAGSHYSCMIALIPRKTYRGEIDRRKHGRYKVFVKL